MKSIIFSFFLICSAFVAAQDYYNTDVQHPLVLENPFIDKTPDKTLPPTFDQAKPLLPQPEWQARPDVVAAYWKAWSIAFDNLYVPTEQNGFVTPYVDAAFNRHIFMWDNSFMAMFGRYGRRAFHFQGTLDNFYAKQHKDGFICREISEITGYENFQKYDVSSTGPNLLPWAEWEYFISVNDTARLRQVFPPLIAYYQWFRANRSWKDGSYFSSGWGCGMDNQPRLEAGYNREFSHGFMSWIDISLQQVFVGKILIRMANLLERPDDVKDIIDEINDLQQFVNAKMWDERSAFYYDVLRNGNFNGVKSIAAYWSLLADVVPGEKLPRLLSHLENENEFARPHRPTTLSADDPGYKPDGGYWCGGVWSPTTYMLLKGLTKHKQDSLAYEIAANHFFQLINVYNETGTFWENYAPEAGFFPAQSRKDFVGWTGITPISILLEYIFGIRPLVSDSHSPSETADIIWDIHFTDAIGVKNYPFGTDATIDFQCARRKKTTDHPRITVKSNRNFTLKLRWERGEEIIKVKAE
ncbi:MAG: glycoside hydrolase [Dysgonamonadaceae bacterium]|jgi:hypothetical protein|nr:glycoside hydrolase [Dysgonamonadaceae bacterium]